MRPIELFGHTAFPTIGEGPYRLSLTPYAFFWFRLEPPMVTGAPEAASAVEPVVLADRGDWGTLEEPWVRERIERFLPTYLAGQRWFRGKGLVIESVRWTATIPLGSEPANPRLGLFDVRFSDAEPQTYLIPLAFGSAAPPTTLAQAAPSHVVAAFRPGPASAERLLHDVTQEAEFARRLISRIGRNRRRREHDDELVAVRTSAFEAEAEGAVDELPVLPLSAEQSNTSTKIGDRYILKLFRLVEPGPNPETELGEFLLRHGPVSVAPLAGYVELRTSRGEVFTLASLHQFIPNEGDAWGLTLDHLRGYFDRARAYYTGRELPGPEHRRLNLQAPDPPADAAELVSGHLETVHRLGRRTAELHRALASEPNDPAFAPEPFDQMYVRSIFQTMQTQRQQVFSRLREVRDRLPAASRQMADEVLAREPAVDERYRQLLGRRYTGQRIRIHGDFHLGQVLWTGKDFVIIDPEGEPLRPVTERRLKRSALRDVAGMLRSFDYAARAALHEIPLASGTSAALSEELQPLADLWVAWTSSAFLRGYREGAERAAFLPGSDEEYRSLLATYMLEKAIYEVGYELTIRPSWLSVPLRGLGHLLSSDG